MFHDFLVLGGAGLVGFQVCRHIVDNLSPRRIVLGSLLEEEARVACRALEDEFGDQVAFVPAWGNLFVPTQLADRPRSEVRSSRTLRGQLLAFLYGPFEAAYPVNHLVHLIRLHRPEVIVDCVNTATGLSYQDVFDGAQRVMEWLGPDGIGPDGVEDLESFLLSQSVPQLIRHIRFLHRATTEYGTQVYVKCGTTGTGGMGLNIPYTHSEDKPSKVLLAKSEAAFGHTGLLFLLARTPKGPVVKEVKPAAMIGYKAVRTVPVTDRYGNDALFQPQRVTIGTDLSLRDDVAGYDESGKLVVSVVDTGENGLFTRGEFAAITALGQMEYVTPEEIARVVVREIVGSNTGQDVISALDGAVMNPSYKAGLLRSVALSDLKHADADSDLPSIALGRLGPPELSKLLFEAQLLKECYGSLADVLHRTDGAKRTAAEVSTALAKRLEKSQVQRIAPSIGIPILLADGRTLLRGPRINVPEVRGHRTTVPLGAGNADEWANKGWIDLRAENVERWLRRVEKMVTARIQLRDSGSAAASTASYLPTEFEIGEVVAWIFNNEMNGYRIK